MKSSLSTSIAVVLLGLAAAPAFAQSEGDWSGAYIGAYAGEVLDPDDGDSILFDTNLDGNFGDTVLTATNANAFSPGFCDGIAIDRTPAAGCTENSGGAEFGLRAGYDWQSGNWVYGGLIEYGMNDIRDAVSAFSTTPARYSMLRKVHDVFAIRGRVGMVFGDNSRNLVYATGGYAIASIENSFTTSNGVNTFTNNGNNNAEGLQFGLGYERKLGDSFTVGIEYLATQLDDNEYRVRAQGPAPATNAFVRTNPAGTDFRRSDEDFDFDGVRITATYRF